MRARVVRQGRHAILGLIKLGTTSNNLGYWEHTLWRSLAMVHAQIALKWPPIKRAIPQDSNVMNS